MTPAWSVCVCSKTSVVLHISVASIYTHGLNNDKKTLCMALCDVTYVYSMLRSLSFVFHAALAQKYYLLITLCYSLHTCSNAR